MKAYKRLEPGLVCRGFKYPEGEWVEFPDAKLCKAGAHACLDPMDTANYYSPAESEIHEVEIEDVSDERGDDSKVVAKRIKIGAKLDVAGIIKAHAEYVKERCTSEKRGGDGASVSGGDSASVSGGDRASVVSRGFSSVGINGIACARGNGCRVRGGMGALLVIAEENQNNYDLAAWKAFVVDGTIYKPDTWYRLQNGELVKCDEPNEDVSE